MMMNRTRYSAISLWMFGALIVFSTLSGTAAYGQTIETIGIGRVDPKIANETQRRATARDAAVQEAEAKMLAILNGQSLNAKTPNPDSAQSDILQGAKVVKTEWIADDQCRVTLRLVKQR